MQKSRKYRRHSLLNDSDDHNPMSGVINVFDVAIVLVMALMVVLAMSPHLPNVLKLGENTTIIRNPGSQNMQIVVKEEGKPIEVMNMTDKIGGGTGEVLGTAYRLADGRVIYVPDNKGNSSSTSSSTSTLGTSTSGTSTNVSSR
jgi:hypothetical protein